MKYTILSKWTVLALTIIAIALVVVSVGVLNSGVGLKVLLIAVAVVIYAFAWFVALFDSIQERRWGWTILLIPLAVTGLGPILYSLFGPKNTR